MNTAASLKSTCTRESLSEEDISSMENLFHRTLGIRNAKGEDIVTELNELREDGCDEDDRIRGLYEYMYDEAYWETVTQCVWTSFHLHIVKMTNVSKTDV